jgi:hypothetical protein
MSAVNPLDQIAIQNVIARYCQSLDTKDFDLLHDVFLPDVFAAVSKAIQNRYVSRDTRAYVA